MSPGLLGTLGPPRPPGPSGPSKPSGLLGLSVQLKQSGQLEQNFKFKN